jgi:hypothetical protein
MKYINDENIFIQEMKILKNINIIKECYQDFQNNKNLKYIIIHIFIINTNFYNKEKNYHANSIILFKNNNANKKYDYLCLRIEPHRHSYLYCRNSIRNYLRNFFDILPNCYYIDYITKDKEGLQAYEDMNIKNSPLQGTSGYCVYWTYYYIFLLLCNKHISFQKIENYITKFNIKKDNIDDIIE